MAKPFKTTIPNQFNEALDIDESGIVDYSLTIDGVEVGHVIVAAKGNLAGDGDEDAS